MKKTKEIIGLPVISISDGNQVGKVKSIIVNADKGAIDYIIVDSGIQALSTRVIPTKDVLGIGEYALTIETPEAINDISKIPSAVDLLKMDIIVKGTKVLTKKGRLIGETGDMYVEEDELCNIIGLEYIADITQKQIKIIPRDKVITFGKNLLVVQEDVEEALLESPSMLVNRSGYDNNKKDIDEDNNNDNNDKFGMMFEKKNLSSESNNNQKEQQEPTVEIKNIDESHVMEPKIEDVSAVDVSDSMEPQAEESEVTADAGTFQQSSNSEVVNEDEKVNVSPNTESAAGLFEERQRQYLNGRKSTKTIVDNTGNVIVHSGDVINDVIINSAKDAGKLVELVMNNEA